MSERTPQRERVLQLLGDGRWHTTLEFVQLGILRVSARVFELRAGGTAIEVARRGRSIYAYRLLETATPTDELNPDAEFERIARKFPDLFEDTGA